MKAGEAIKQIRLDSGRTQREVADKLGLISQNLYYFESSGNSISVNNLLDVLGELGCSLKIQSDGREIEIQNESKESGKYNLVSD